MQTVSRLLLLLLAGGSLMVGEVSATCQCLDDNCVAELGDVVVPAEGQTKHGGKFVLKEQKYYCSVLNDGSCPDGSPIIMPATWSLKMSRKHGRKRGNIVAG